MIRSLPEFLQYQIKPNYTSLVSWRFGRFRVVVVHVRKRAGLCSPSPSDLTRTGATRIACAETPQFLASFVAAIGRAGEWVKGSRCCIRLKGSVEGQDLLHFST